LTRRPPQVWRPIAVAAMVLLSCCTMDASDGLPPADPIVDRFIRAWNDADGTTMATLVDGSSWTARRFERLLARVGRQGALSSYVVERTAAVDEAPQGGRRATARVPYSVAYSSPAAARTARLGGSLHLRYDRGDGRWRLMWSRALLWPGISGARSFRVQYRWPERAPIVDRAGRPLARGQAPRRVYPFGSVGGSVVGHIGPLDRSAARRPYRAGDLVGASGLEQAYERRLAGSPASRLVVVGSRGRVLETLGRRPGRPGRPVRTTLDAVVQRSAERAFEGVVGAAAVLDPSSGDLLAAVSSGTFDPNDYVGGAGVTPFNRALSGRYPPGSAMKVVTAAAALQEGTVTPETELPGPAEYRGVRNFESGRFGTIDFGSALANSVNTVFARVAEKLGAARLTRYARAFGFSRPPSMALEAATSSFPRPVDDYDLRWSAIGQAQVIATPLQMASVAATIANHGRRVEPRATFLDTRRGARAVSARTAGTLTSLMRAVVERGTGVRAAIPGVEIAGKTGTAEVDVNGVRRNHAWFIAFAPAGDPRVALAVVVEYGGVGGEVGAPLAARVLEAVLPLAR
jgi:hypothetical protein